MTMISDKYKRLNMQLHKRQSFGGSGYRWVNDIYEGMMAMKPVKFHSLLDYGCGHSTFWEAFQKKYSCYSRGIKYSEYDPGVPNKDIPPRSPADLVVCTDVLEHVEPCYINNVIFRIFTLARIALYLNIAMLPANKQLPNGENAHLIVKPRAWWLDKILEVAGEMVGKIELVKSKKPEKDLNLWITKS